MSQQLSSVISDTILPYYRRLSLDKGDIEVANAADADEVLLMGALSAKWTNNDAIDKVHSPDQQAFNVSNPVQAYVFRFLRL